MSKRRGVGAKGEQLVTREEVAELMGTSTRMVELQPLRQIKLGPRTIRYRLSEVYEYLGIENPNL